MAERRRGLLRQTDQAKAQTRGILSIVELQAAINRYLAECQPRPAAIPLDKGPAQNYRSCQERAPSVRFYSLVEARKTGSDHQRVEFAGLASLTARNVPTCPPCLPDPLPFGPGASLQVSDPRTTATLSGMPPCQAGGNTRRRPGRYPACLAISPQPPEVDALRRKASKSAVIVPDVQPTFCHEER
jgi:hypothetical protein